MKWNVPGKKKLFSLQIAFLLCSGLCGVYDGSRTNDLHWRNGSVIYLRQAQRQAARPQPADFIRQWRFGWSFSLSLWTKLFSVAQHRWPPGYWCNRLSNRGQSQVIQHYSYIIDLDSLVWQSHRYESVSRFSCLIQCLQPSSLWSLNIVVVVVIT